MLLIRDWRNKLIDINFLEQQEIEHQSKNVQEEVVQKEKENIEEVQEPSSMNSEDVHGGNEATGDIEDSPNAKDDGNQKSENSSSNNNSESESNSDSTSSNESESDLEQDLENDKNSELKNEESSESKNSENLSKANVENSEQDLEDNEIELSHSDYEIEEQECDNEEDYDYNADEINHRSYYKELQQLKNKRLQSALAIVISKLAEDLCGYDIEGDDLWNINELMLRRFNNRPLQSCRKSLEREKIIIALDFSGSCYGYSEFFQSIAKLAEKFGDVEIFNASNGFSEENYCISNNKSYALDYFTNRTIIFFGDFDGGASLVELSKKSNLYWFSCEERYDDLYQHDWCADYKLSDFKNYNKKYFECTNEDDFLKLIKKVKR